MRKESNNWTLAADAGMLLYLKKFSQKIIARTHDIGLLVDGLALDTQMADARLHNHFNEFQMLANTQFIENRVFDEASEAPALVQAAEKEKEKGKEKEKTREQREAEIVPKFKLALQVLIFIVV